VHNAYFQKHGIPEFLSPEAYDFSWTQYQGLMVDKLNLLTQGKAQTLLLKWASIGQIIEAKGHRTDYISEDTVDADLKPGDLLVKYSRRPEMASVFNYASMAHNNHFFFNCLVSIDFTWQRQRHFSNMTSAVSYSHPDSRNLRERDQQILLVRRIPQARLPRDGKRHVRPRFRLAR
jgi:superoxide dismutase